MSQSYWSKDIQLPSFPSLRENHQTDCLVIGAGIGGLTTAYLLLKKGCRVTIVDRDGIAGGQTSLTTGHLSNLLDDRFHELETYFHTSGLKDAISSHMDAIQFIKNSGISCDFEEVSAFLFLHENDVSDTLEKEFQAAKKAEVKEAALTSLPFDPSKKAFMMSSQGQFHPLKYMLGLTALIEKMGGKIHLRTSVVEVTGGDMCLTTTHEGFTIASKSVVVATNVPIHTKFVMHTKQAAYRTYAFAAHVKKGSIPKGLYYDTADPYHYIRLYGDDVLIVGGEDHKTGQENHPLECYTRLESWARKYFNFGDIVSRWSGQILEPIDSLGFMGRDPLEKNIYMITGDSGNGLTHATIGAHIISDEILGQKNRYAYLYDPKRKTISAGMEFIKENINVAEQYLDWAKKEEVPENLLAPTCGMVIQKKGKKVAVYRDEHGEDHEFSAVCPHLGCIVHWNEAEKSFDCPCHGSRFNCKGEVLNGPAVTPLEELKKESIS